MVSQRFRPTLRDGGRLRTAIVPTTSGEGEGRKRCQEAAACWLLWTNKFTLLGLTLLICKMGPGEECLLSHLVAERMRQMWVCEPRVCVP
jgi:hypothetical protein